MRVKTNNERRVGRRNLIAGLLSGVILATVAGAYATTTFKKMVSGQKATAADVNKAHQDLADAIDKLEAKVTAQAAKIAKLETDPDCPPGYTRDTTAPSSITVCTKGKDEMVKVGGLLGGPLRNSDRGLDPVQGWNVRRPRDSLWPVVGQLPQRVPR